MHKEKNDRIFLGFWIYLMTDLIMFAVLFATYAVLRNNTFGAISISEILNLPFVLIETIVLLTSSFLCGVGMLAAYTKNRTKTFVSFSAVFLLGAIFLGMELYEFGTLILEGNTPSKSAFLSAFFTLLGTHGLHIFVGLIWMLILFFYIFKRGLTEGNTRKLTLFAYFWHFLDLVWIFIFTIVYLFGGIL